MHQTIVVSLLTLALLPLKAQEAAAEIRSGENRLAIDRATGRISLLTLGQRNLLGSPVPPKKRAGVLDEINDTRIPGGPFRLHAPLPDFEARLVDAANSKPAIEPAGGGKGLVVRYPNLLARGKPTNISAVVRITSGGDGTFRMRLELKNGSDNPIPQVFFPWIAGVAPVEGPRDQVKFGKSNMKPWSHFKALRDSEAPLFMKYLSAPEFELSYVSPYASGMKWMDFGGQAAGVSLFSEDTTAQDQYFYIGADSYGASTINLSWFFYPFVPAGAAWSSPVFVLYPHRGDWHYGVLKFKEFTDKNFVPVASTPARDETIGQFSTWLSWHYQDWSRVRYHFKDLPEIAAEARRAGFREMTVARATALDFRLPPVVREPLGTDADLKNAVEQARKLGVNIIPFFTCHIIDPKTIPAGQDVNDWFIKNVAGQFVGSNYTYHPTMIPRKNFRQIGTRAGYYACVGSQSWRKAFRDAVELLQQKWGYHGYFFDLSMPVGGLCFNPLHKHPPSAQGDLLSEVLGQSRRLLGARFPDAVVTGEGQWDVATQWMDFTWDWDEFNTSEEMAPFHMAFPKARYCAKTNEKRSLINRIFASGNWLDLYLEEGGGRLRDYPELANYLASLSVFKKHFVNFFSRRDAYLHNMYVKVQPGNQPWIRVHRSGNEALVMVTQATGKAADFDLALDVRGILGRQGQAATLWSRDLKQLASVPAADEARLHVHVPAEDFVAIHLK